jgi:hypothetical protein
MNRPTKTSSIPALSNKAEVSNLTEVSNLLKGRIRIAATVFSDEFMGVLLTFLSSDRQSHAE